MTIFKNGRHQKWPPSPRQDDSGRWTPKHLSVFPQVCSKVYLLMV